MSEVDAEHGLGEPRRRSTWLATALVWLRRRLEELFVVFLVLLVFGVAGPFIGGIFFYAVLVAFEIFRHGLSTGILGNTPLMLVFVVPVSYTIGFQPALLAGFFVAAKKVWLGGVGPLYAAIAGGLAANLPALVSPPSTNAPKMMALMALTGVVSSLACWRIIGGKPIVHL